MAKLFTLDTGTRRLVLICTHSSFLEPTNANSFLHIWMVIEKNPWGFGQSVCRYNTHLNLIVGGPKSLYYRTRCQRKRRKTNSLQIHWGIQNGYVLFSVKNGELLMINITRSQLFCNHFPSDFHWRLRGWKCRSNVSLFYQPYASACLSFSFLWSV